MGIYTHIYLLVISKKKASSLCDNASWPCGVYFILLISLSFFLSVSITLVHPSLYLYACIYVIYFIYVPAAVADPLLKMPINKAHLSFAPTFICKLFVPSTLPK